MAMATNEPRAQCLRPKVRTTKKQKHVTTTITYSITGKNDGLKYVFSPCYSAIFRGPEGQRGEAGRISTHWVWLIRDACVEIQL